jgi:hypothetical protein
MTQTVLQVVTDAYRRSNIVDQISVPSAEQGAVGLSLLNDMLADMAADGVRLGWFPQTSLTNQAPLKDMDLRPVKWLLAAEIMSFFGITPTPIQTAEITSANNKLAKRAINYFESSLTGLPWAQADAVGSGRLS